MSRDSPVTSNAVDVSWVAPHRGSIPSSDASISRLITEPEEAMFAMTSPSDSPLDILSSLNFRVAQLLWSMGRRPSENRVDFPHLSVNASRPKLIFPHYRSRKVRISEQEPRVLFCHLLDAERWLYSIETPTLGRFRFKKDGTHDLSARSDLSLYAASAPWCKLVNIEFKAKNPVAAAFEKDFEKLLREGIDGVWFHVLEAADGDTCRSVFNKTARALRQNRKDIGDRLRTILFAYCTLDTPRLCQARLKLGDPSDDLDASINSLFRLMPDHSHPASPPWLFEGVEQTS